MDLSTRVARRAAALAGATLALLIPAFLTAAPGASAAPTFGYGDQNTAMFTDQRWLDLPLRNVRRTVDWDTSTDTAKTLDLDTWMTAARTAGASPLLSIDRSWTAGKEKKKPSVAQYTLLIKWLKQRYPWWNTITPWNEANYIGQPTVRDPKTTYKYYQAAKKTCSGCTVTSPSLLKGQGASSKFLKDYYKLAGSKTRLWAVHVYGDGNRLTDTSLKSFEKEVKGQIWVTETAGWVKFGDSAKWKYDEKRAAKVIDFTFKTAKKHQSRVKRWYFWQWLGNTSKESRWDSGVLNADGTERPGYLSLVKGLKG